MTDENKPKIDAKNVEYDKFKDSELRYLGYANEIGEAFRNVIPTVIVAGTYGVAVAYVLGDTLDKLINRNDGVKYALDTLIWQSLASVAIPGFTINRICWMTGKLTSHLKGGKIITTAVGLCSIPFIITPIDELVHYGMNKTIRPILDVPPNK